MRHSSDLVRQWWNRSNGHILETYFWMRFRNADRFHRKRTHLKTLLRVETFENGASDRISVDSENGGFRKHIKHREYRLIYRFVACADGCCSVFERIRAF